MRHCCRHLFTFCSAVSLLLLVVVCVVGVRNRRATERFGLARDGWSGDRLYRTAAAGVVVSGGGFRLCVHRGETDFPTITDHSRDFREPMDAARYHWWHPGGASVIHDRVSQVGRPESTWHGFTVKLLAENTPRYTDSEWEFVAPGWFVAVIAGLPFACRAVPRAIARVRARHRPECCRKCGYDLRASPQRCPGVWVPLLTDATI